MRKEKTLNHCVQCGKKMHYGTNWDKFVPVCTYPKCPNYGLLQIGIENMPKGGDPNED